MIKHTMIKYSAIKSTVQLILLASVFLITNQFNAQAADIVKLDRIVAVVDQTVITEQELESRIATVTAQFKKQGTELPEESVLRKPKRTINVFN